MPKKEIPTENKELLEVKIITLGKTIWSGQAEAVSAVNVSGPFDVLPQHVNFISVLTHLPIKIKTATGGKEEFALPRSVMQVKNNQVTIYAEI